MKDIYKNTPIPTSKKIVRKIEVSHQSAEIPVILKLDLPKTPELQKVEVVNPTPPADPIEFPDIQKVKVTNPPPLIEFPKIQRVQVLNPTPVSPPASLRNVERLLNDIYLKRYPTEIKVSNPTPEVDIPIGEGNKAGSADPTRYVPVRLTNGKNFYEGMSDAFVSANQRSFPFINYLTGKPQAAAVDNDGTLRTDVEITGITVTVSGTTTSGSPGYAFQTNIPTIQSVFVTNPSSASVTTTSGTPLDVTVRNFPTVQTVSVQNFPAAATTTSGSPQFSYQTNIPTIQSIYGQVVGDVPSQGIDASNPVKVGGSRRATLPVYSDGTRSAFHVDENGLLLIRPGQPVTISGITTISGSANQHVFVDNIPTVQTVNVQNVTSVSGLQNTHVDNFPTIQTVRDQSLTISGSQHTIVDNFPTIQTVRDQSLTISGSQHTIVDNFPTIHTIQGQAQITDGNVIANIFSPGGNVPLGQNALMTAPALLTVPFTTTSGIALGTTDVSNYKSVSVYVSNIGTNGVVNFQQSSDNINWVALNLADTVGNTSPASSRNSAGHLDAGSLSAKYFRVNITGISAGTLSGVIVFSTASYSPPNVGVFNQVTVLGNKSQNNAAPGATSIGVLPAIANASNPPYSEGNQVLLSTDLIGNLRTTSSGIGATGIAVPTSAFYMGIRDNTSLLIGMRDIDNAANGSSAGILATMAYLFNGTKGDRPLEIVNATNSTGTGIAAVGLVGQFDDVSPTSITENQFGNLRMSANRNLYGTIRDAAGNERGANVDLSGNLNVTMSGVLNPGGTTITPFSVHLTGNGTNTPTNTTAYISSIAISNEVGGTTSTVTIQDKQGTPLKLVNGLATTALTTAPTVITFQTPVIMVGGIDIITAGAVAATIDVWITYYK